MLKGIKSGRESKKENRSHEPNRNVEFMHQKVSFVHLIQSLTSSLSYLFFFSSCSRVTEQTEIIKWKRKEENCEKNSSKK